jgi:hypothetical protein
MKTIKITFFVVLSFVTLTSSIAVKKSLGVENNVFTCAGTTYINLNGISGGPQNFVSSNTDYVVWATGGVNSEFACIRPNPGYTIGGISGCQDIGDGNSYPIGTIHTSATLGTAGIIILIETHCVSGETAITSRSYRSR